MSRLVSIAILLASTTAAAVPLQLTHQGRLLDSSDVPLTGTQTVTFTFWDGSTGTNVLWTDDLSVTFDNGFFGVVLGEGGNPIDENVLDNTEVWMSLTINSEELLPRQRVNSVPYAVMAGTAENAATLGGAHATDLEESAEIDGDIASHVADASAHHPPTADTTCNDAGVTCNFASSATEGGAATSALALATNGTNCGAGEWAAGVDASGAAEGCTEDAINDADADASNELQTLAGVLTRGAVAGADQDLTVGDGAICVDDGSGDCEGALTDGFIYADALQATTVCTGTSCTADLKGAAVYMVSNNNCDSLSSLTLAATCSGSASGCSAGLCRRCDGVGCSNCSVAGFTICSNSLTGFYLVGP